MRKAFFFDLDGTLLPLDMDAFSRLYFGAIKKSGFFDRICENRGEGIFEKAIYEMMQNDGRANNRDVFFQAIEDMSGAAPDDLMPHMERFYRNEYKQVRKCTRMDGRVKESIKELKDKGYRLVLATNPLFPPIATDQRVEWAGLSPNDFEYISYYNNSSYCKPNPNYFLEILDHMGLDADECYIVGNDVRDDMSAAALGFEGFLVLDHVIGDIEKVPECKKGDYSDLLDFARSLPQI
ncbi:MAG: HAD family hydrolase [Eubacteriales bacterium]|nr:HAD family hydrolase [Eubacteriales bacterium]